MADESKIKEIVSAYPFKKGTTLSHTSLNQICEGLGNVTDDINTKQDVISDLGTIRSGAALGATAVQPNALNNYYTKDVTDGKLDAKQDTITDLGTIRSGAALGATAVQPNALNNYYTKNETDAELATKQDTLTAGDNIQIENNVISATDTKYVAGDFDIKDLNDTTGLRTKWDNAATLAASAIQPNVLEQQLSNYLTETEVNALIAEIHSFEVEIVNVLPESGNTHTIYFVPAGDGVESDFYNEYMYINGKMELIGNTRIDLSGYYTKDEIDGELATKQNTLVAGTNIEISGDTISSKVYEASDFDIKDLSDITGLRATWSSKQDAITDLDDIRTGAALGETAIQESDLQTVLSGYYTSGQTDELLDEKQDVINNLSEIEQNAASGKTAFDSLITKQDVIEDLDDIRTGAELGATAVQKSDLQTELGGYYTSGQTDDLLATKQNVITDLGTIRSGAALGATALQSDALIPYFTSAQTISLIGEIDHFNVEVVTELPVSGEPNTIYFVAAEGGESGDTKNEYIYVKGKWELIGTTRIDLTDYYTKDETDGLLATKQNVITDLGTIRSGAALGATAIQKSDLQTALSGYYTSGATDELLATKQDVLTAGSHIEISANTISVVGLSDVLYTEITYSELVSLRDASGLTPGMQYRLTDYTTTVNPSLSDVQSAGHVFDIILVADDETTLNENVRFIHHEGDTYFADSDLSAWEGKYSLTNDTNKFAWADPTNGKGVIYWLKDEWNNECPYDFKNIQFNVLFEFTYNQLGSEYSFTRNTSLDEEINGVIYYGYTCSTTPEYWDSPNCFVTDSPITATSTLYSTPGGSTISYGGNIVSVNSEEKYGIYTFSVDNNSIFEDGSLLSSNNIYGNVILNYIKESKLILNRIWFIGTNNKGNTFGTDCYNNSFGTDCYYNTFGNRCYQNTFGNYFQYNTFGNYCGSNTFGNYCGNNTFGNYCWGNTFGNDFQTNTFGNDFYHNTFGNNCGSNTFGNYCNYNTFGNYCYYNTFGNYCGSNTFGSGCQGNTFGNYCESNTFGNNCNSNTFGDYFRFNTFGNGCYCNTFKHGYITNCRFGDGVAYCTISGYNNLDNYGNDYYYLSNIVVLNGTCGNYNQSLELNQNQIFNTHNFKENGDLVPQIVCGFFVNEYDRMTYIAKYYFAATLG